MGSTGFALNGVVFYNPFDAGIAMRRHDGSLLRPSEPRYRYHYHKYPVCVKSPFVDAGEEHSPLSVSPSTASRSMVRTRARD